MDPKQNKKNWKKKHTNKKLEKRYIGKKNTRFLLNKIKLGKFQLKKNKSKPSPAI